MGKKVLMFPPPGEVHAVNKHEIQRNVKGEWMSVLKCVCVCVYAQRECESVKIKPL